MHGSELIDNGDVPRGGKRPGAGRKPPPEGRLELLSVRVPADVLKLLKSEAERRGVTAREVIVDLVRRYLGRKSPAKQTPSGQPPASASVRSAWSARAKKD
jgi:hypothetical protein